MHTEIRYNNLLKEIDEIFPGFQNYLEDKQQAIEENESAYLTFLSIYVREHWQVVSLHAKLADFINAMEASTNAALKPVYDDFLLDFYLSCKEQSISLLSFLNQLSHPAQERMIYNYNYWIEENNKVTDGSR